MIAAANTKLPYGWTTEPGSSGPDPQTAGEVAVSSEGDIVAARKVVRDAASGIGFSLIDVTRIVTAASELSRNIFHYAGSGTMRWRVLNQAGKTGIELIFEDHGPGIPDIARAMEPGYT